MKALKTLRNEMIAIQLFKSETDFDNFVIEMDSASEKAMDRFQDLTSCRVEIENAILIAFQNIAVYGDVSKLVLKNYTVEKLLTYDAMEGELYAKIINVDSEDSYLAVLTITEKGGLEIRRMLRKL